MGYGEVINIPCCLNGAQEVLIPNPLETHLGLIRRSTFNLTRTHKHAGVFVIASKDQSIEFVIRQTTDAICACRKRLLSDYKPEGQSYNNLTTDLRISSQTQPKK